MESLTKYRCSRSEDNDEYTTEEIARHKKFVWNLNTTKKVVSRRSETGRWQT